MEVSWEWKSHAIFFSLKIREDKDGISWSPLLGSIYRHHCTLLIYIYIYMRWVQVILGITLKSYTFSKPLDLSKSNGKKRILINVNILIKISFIILYLWHFILISKAKKMYMFLSLSSITLPPPRLGHYHVFFCPKIVWSNILHVQPIYPHIEFFLSHSWGQTSC